MNFPFIVLEGQVYRGFGCDPDEETDGHTGNAVSTTTTTTTGPQMEVHEGL